MRLYHGEQVSSAEADSSFPTHTLPGMRGGAFSFRGNAACCNSVSSALLSSEFGESLVSG